MTQTVVIAGGGIGGLAAALGLANKGFEVKVLEQSNKLGEIGAGIQIGPNAFHALDYLGVGEEARQRAVFIDKLVMMDSLSGEQVADIPVNEPFREYFGNPYAVIHRGDLHGVLLTACEQHEHVKLLTKQSVCGYDHAADLVTVETEQGDRYAADALVGADGLNSKVRQQLVGDGEPRVSGHIAYRALMPFDKMPEDLRWNAATLWAGPKTHIVHYPLKGWEVFNIVCVFHDQTRTEPAANAPGSRDEVMQRFDHVCAKPKSILEALFEWRYWVLCDREPIETWVDGRVALLGDAAHPMMQYFAQGACQAMEDAVCLAHKVAARDGDFEQGMLDYQAERVVRTARVQISSRLIGDYLYHAEGVTRLVRNAMYSKREPEEWYSSLKWLYGGTGLDSTV
ncbi:MAG: 3-hydroxybenzoate 6-monooxygenase [Arenicellales bacterium]|nr:3-hydroxybenzoate 6-monooxygenase [Arenicellales bacterium]